MRLLLLLPTRTYRTEDFVKAALESGVDLVVGSEEQNVLEGTFPERYLTVDLVDPAVAVEQVGAFHGRFPIDAVVGVDDQTTVVCAALAEALGIRWNPLSAARKSRDKYLSRQSFAAHGLPTPWFRRIQADDDPTALASELGYPAVVKPTRLSASRGVIRVDDEAEFVDAVARLRRLLADSEFEHLGEDRHHLVVEGYIPGEEVALEGLLTGGRLEVLALLDKPDPLIGPYFEETLFVTPSRLPEPVQQAVVECAGRAAGALGLTEGPVHAEMRVNDEGVWPLEIAARSIGGLCSRALRFGSGVTLEMLIVRHALGLGLADLRREQLASGVMMIPIPRAGRFQGVAGVDGSRQLPGIDEITITVHPGDQLVPLPEGSRYLGFIFARRETPAEVEAVLRAAHRGLRFDITS